MKEPPACAGGFFISPISSQGPDVRQRAWWRSTVLVLVAMATVARGAGAQSTVRGAVHDSIAGGPLAGALVQLVAADSAARFGSTEVADSLGRFVFTGVPAGRYTIGFFHPMLDSLGLEPMLRAVSVDADRTVRVDLATPSSARLRAAICDATTGEKPAAVVMGFVRDARTGAPAAGVRVMGEWVELSIGRGGVVRNTPRRVTTTRESGWFAICNVPSPGAMVLMASRGADSTDFVEVQVPPEGFLRRELHLGPKRTEMAVDSVVGDSARRGDSLPPPRRVNVGDGLLRGLVVAADGGRPLGGAQVGIANGPQTRANQRGEWTLANAPAGTRTLEVRSVGFYPERQVVDVIDDAPPVRVALVTFRSVLDTMKVIANYNRFSNLAGFRERSRTGPGRFLSAADIARRQPIVASDLFRNFPGLFLDGPRGYDQQIMMRGLFAERCAPAVYLNGAVMNGLSANDVDGFVRPEEIVGIEVYAQNQAPAQFQLGMTDCGSIVIWTK